jgi:3-oxoacyl-(acyl-carrier-protein) synthase
LVVTAEAALLPMFIHSYRRLGVLAGLTPEDYRQRPLDARRSGFMLSEAGAAVLLRRLPAGEAPGPGQIELVDSAIAAEAHDMIRPSANMDALRHIASQLMGERRIDMVHPHAPGTAEHDPIELAAYQPASSGVQADSTQPLDVYACKGALGHSLGAAGLSALVLACLCLKTGQRPPMPWLQQPMDTHDGQAQTLKSEGQRRSRIGTHAVFAAGFAGHTAGAIVQRH